MPELSKAGLAFVATPKGRELQAALYGSLNRLGLTEKDGSATQDADETRANLFIYISVP